MIETKNAFVQGGTKGIGRAMVEQLLGQGTRVFASGRCATTSFASLQQSYGTQLEPIDVDVTDEAQIAKAAQRISERCTHLDLVLHVTGLLHDSARNLHPEKKLEHCTQENLTRVFQVNAVAPLLFAKHLMPLIGGENAARSGLATEERLRTVIANVSARVGSIEDNRLGGWYAYRASKAAQNMFTKNLSIELARRAGHVICIALHPGTVNTDLSRPFQRSVPAGKLFSTERAAKQLLSICDRVTPEDHGRFIAWDGKTIPW